MTSSHAISPKAATNFRARLRAASREQLLDTAEQLFAERGIGGVSLREIAAAAGQKNNSAVHYYFKDKPGLVDALITDRMAKVEQLRSRHVEKAGDLSGYGADALLRMLWQPMLDLCMRHGGTWIIQLHLSYHLSNPKLFNTHPIVADPAHHPASGKLLSALAARFPDIPSQELRYRQGLVFFMFWTAVSRHSTSRDDQSEPLSTFPLDTIIRMAVAALGVSE